MQVCIHSEVHPELFCTHIYGKTLRWYFVIPWFTLTNEESNVFLDSCERLKNYAKDVQQFLSFLGTRYILPLGVLLHHVPLSATCLVEAQTNTLFQI